MFAGYMLIRETDTGERLEPVELTAQGFPSEGQEIEWETEIYRVYRVRHSPDPSSLSDDLNHMAAHVWARKVEPASDRPKAGSASPLGSFVMLPPRFDQSSQSVILPPALLAVLVLAGYDTLKIQFRKSRRDVAQLVRTGGGTWLLVREAWRLSRLAKRHRNDVITFITGSWLGASETLAPMSAASPPTSNQPGAPSPPQARPTLRLVSVQSDL